LGSLVRHRSRNRPIIKQASLIALVLPVLAASVPPPGAAVIVTVAGLRSNHGQVIACLTAKPRGFPNCSKDPAARIVAVPAAASVTLRFAAVPAGTYAISLLHDEDGNGRPAMALFLPREGFGTSRNAPLRFGPPRFAAAAFAVADLAVTMPITMRYMF
jgi:uncharacterized protein (DUF2141 family)